MKILFLSAMVGALLLTGCVKYKTKRGDPFFQEFDGVEYMVARVLAKPKDSEDPWKFRNYDVKINGQWYECPEGQPVESCANTIALRERMAAAARDSSSDDDGGGGGGDGGTDL